MERGYQPGDTSILQVMVDEVNALEALCQSSQLMDRLEHGLHIVKEAITHQPQQIAFTSDDALITSNRQKRSSSQMSIGSVEHHDVGMDIAGPSTVYTPQDYYVPQPPQDYYMPLPSQDDWFQSAPYMPTQTQDYSSHVHLDLGLGIN
ncbi:UNVERIFIED_CONTAM: hypothetical protein Sindi_1823400 [Sesamum indicum]